MANINQRLFGDDILPDVKAKLALRQALAKNPDFGQAIDAVTSYVEEEDLPDGIFDLLVHNFVDYKDGIKIQADLSSRTPFARMWTAVQAVDFYETEWHVSKKYNPQSLGGYADNLSTPQLPNDALFSAVVKNELMDGGVTPQNNYYEIRNDPNDNNKVKTMYRKIIDPDWLGDPQIYIVGNHVLNTLSKKSTTPNEPTVPESLTRAQIAASAYPEEFDSQKIPNEFMRPPAGITSVAVTTEGSLGMIKVTTVNFVVHNFHDYDKIYSKYFLRPGSQIFVDFGWDTVSLYKPEDILTEATRQKLNKGTTVEDVLWGFGRAEDMSSEWDIEPGYITEAAGDMETLMGYVTSYNATVRENGSVDCVVEITSRNIAAFDKSLSDDSALLKDIFVDNLSDLLRDQAKLIQLHPEVINLMNDMIQHVARELEQEKKIDQAKLDILKATTVDTKQWAGAAASTSQLLTNTFGLLGELFGEGTPNVDVLLIVNKTWKAFLKEHVGDDDIFFESFGSGTSMGLRNTPITELSLGHGFFWNALTKNEEVSDANFYISFKNLEDLIFNTIWGKFLSTGTNATNTESLETTPRMSSKWSAIRVNQKLKHRQMRIPHPEATKLKFLYPAMVYMPNNRGEIYEIDINRVTSMPLQQLFISVETIKDAFRDGNSLIGAVQNILEVLNENSEGFYKLAFGTNAGMGDSSTISIVDKGKTVVENESTDDFFNNLFMFKPLSPNSIVKGYNLGMGVPSDEYASMIAISNAAPGRKMIPWSFASDKHIAMKDLDNVESTLDVAYLPTLPTTPTVDIENVYQRLLSKKGTGIRSVLDDHFNLDMSHPDRLPIPGTTKMISIEKAVRFDENIIVEGESTRPHGQLTGRYTIKSGDGLTAIARSLNVSQADLESWNNIDDPNSIGVGDILIYTIPGSRVEEEVVETTPLGSDLDIILAGGKKFDDPDKYALVADSFFDWYGRKVRIDTMTNVASTIYPLTLTLKIYGIASIIPGNCLRVDYVPERYRDQSYFQVMKISHEINSSTWSTILELQFIIRPKKLNSPDSLKKSYKDNVPFYIDRKNFNDYLRNWKKYGNMFSHIVQIDHDIGKYPNIDLVLKASFDIRQFPFDLKDGETITKDTVPRMLIEDTLPRMEAGAALRAVSGQYAGLPFNSPTDKDAFVGSSDGERFYVDGVPVIEDLLYIERKGLTGAFTREFTPEMWKGATARKGILQGIRDNFDGYTTWNELGEIINGWYWDIAEKGTYDTTVKKGQPGQVYNTQLLRYVYPRGGETSYSMDQENIIKPLPSYIPLLRSRTSNSTLNIPYETEAYILVGGGDAGYWTVCFKQPTKYKESLEKTIIRKGKNPEIATAEDRSFPSTYMFYSPEFEWGAIKFFDFLMESYRDYGESDVITLHNVRTVSKTIYNPKFYIIAREEIMNATRGVGHYRRWKSKWKAIGSDNKEKYKKHFNLKNKIFVDDVAGTWPDESNVYSYQMDFADLQNGKLPGNFESQVMWTSLTRASVKPKSAADLH